MAGCGGKRSPNACASKRLLLIPAVLLVVSLAPAVQAGAAAPPAATAVSDSGAAQELSLADLGAADQTVRGESPSARVYFPPPFGRLAPAGNFFRVFLSHSPLTGGGSSMAVLVNGHPVTTIALDAGTAAGTVVEVLTPGSILRSDLPNQLEARFHLAAVGGPPQPEALFARLQAGTLIHYQLALPAGPAGAGELATYPFPILSLAGAEPARVGMVLPPAPQPGEVAAAMRLAADLGRLGDARGVQPVVVTAGAADWLRRADMPAVLVGVLKRLPVAAPVLSAAGFALHGDDWTAPDGASLNSGDGLLVEVASPWNAKRSILIATGLTEDALAKAASALVARPRETAGTYAIVRGAAPSPPHRPAGEGSVPLEGMLGEQSVVGAGQHTLTAGFHAPAVAAGANGHVDLRLRFGSDFPRGGGSTLAVLLNGGTASSAPLDGGRGAIDLRIPLPGGLFRPGRNVLTLAFDIVSRPAPGGSTTGGSVAVSAAPQIAVPGPPPTSSLLQALAYPFLDASSASGPRLLLPDAGDRTLSAAAEVMAALGSRSAYPPPALEAATPGPRQPVLTGGDLIVIAPALPTRGLAGDLRALRIDAGQALIEEGSMPGGGAGRVLTVAGAQAAAPSVAAALRAQSLHGDAAIVKQGGETHLIAAVPSEIRSPLAELLVLAAAAGAAALLLIAVGQQVLASRDVGS